MKELVQYAKESGCVEHYWGKHAHLMEVTDISSTIRETTSRKSTSAKAKFAGSRRVLATAVEDWSDNLLALAPVQAYAHVQ
jgi:hypothetical protein